MKKIILLSTMLVGTMLMAQQPFGKNATWVIVYGEGGYGGFREITYSHDTIINGEAWQKFSESGVSEIRTGPKPSDLRQTKYSGKTFGFMFLTRNDSVFRMDQQGQSSLLYDYNAQVGDEWQFAPWDTTLASCLDTPIVTVTAIGFDTIQGQAIKYWDLEDRKDTIKAYTPNVYRCSSGWCMGGRLYERIGGMAAPLPLATSQYFGPIPNLCNGASFQLPSYILRCYSDANININLTSDSCDHWDFVGLNEHTLVDFNLYPNPSNSQKIEIDSPASFNQINIYGLHGELLLRQNVKNTQNTIMDIDLPIGLYVLQLKQDGQLLGGKKLMVR